MNDERLQILRMIQEGKLSPEEAAKLLDVVEQPDGKANGKKPRMLRMQIVDGPKTQTVSLNLALVRWFLKLPGVTIVGEGGKIDRETLLDAVSSGTIGKVFEAEEGKYRVELWLDA